MSIMNEVCDKIGADENSSLRARINLAESMIEECCGYAPLDVRKGAILDLANTWLSIHQEERDKPLSFYDTRAYKACAEFAEGAKEEAFEGATCYIEKVAPDIPEEVKNIFTSEYADCIMHPATSKDKEEFLMDFILPWRAYPIIPPIR